MPETQFTQVQYTLQGLMNQIQMGQIGLPDIQQAELLGKGGEKVMVKTEDETKHDHLTGCIRAFLEGKQTIKWVMNFVKGHRLPRTVLQEILTSAKPGADPARYEELVSACREEGLI